MAPLLGPSSTEPHVSIYPWSWLRQNSYSNPPIPQPAEYYLLLPKHTYQSLTIVQESFMGIENSKRSAVSIL
jgi:hypothetical protein